MFHSITVAGYLGGDPVLRYTPEGQAQCNFSVAASNRKDETAWFRITVFGKQAEACNQYLKKGRPVLVVGRLRVDEKTGGPKVFQRQDGSYAASFEVTADNVRFLGGDNHEDRQPAEAQTNDSIPF